MYKNIFVSLFLIFITLIQLAAQDKIIKYNKKVIDCRIQEITTEEIKYKFSDTLVDIVISIDLDKVDSIELSNGHFITIKNESVNPENYVNDKKSIIKVDFLSPLTGDLSFSFERNIKTHCSFETDLGLIGLGWNELNSRKSVVGIFLKGGIKYFIIPKGKTYSRHILEGLYIKPELALSTFSFRKAYGNTSRIKANSGAFLLNFGYQVISNNNFSLDLYFGIGYGISSRNYSGTEYGFNIATSDFPFTYSGGIRIGKLLNGKYTN